jgi:hypothetical protein
MDVGIVDRIFETSLSLGVLAVVLFGLYRLTDRVIDVISVHLRSCCESLERVADALERIGKE